MLLEHISYGLNRQGCFLASLLKAAEPSGKWQSRAASGRSTSRRVALVPQSGLKKAERSGAENEAVFTYFLWRRERSKETST